MKSVKEELKKHGIEFESKYLLYRTDARTLAIPYSHMRVIEFRGGKVHIYTGGIDKLTIEVPNEALSYTLFEELLVYIERSFM